MLDFTKEIKLPSAWQKKYLVSKTIVYLVFFTAALLAVHSIIFPSFNAQYFFSVSEAKKSTLVEQPKDSSGNPLKNDALTNGGSFEFNASRLGKFSNAIISFSLKDNSLPISTNKIVASKAYAALFYPLGDPIGFKNGSLLKNGNDFYIVSENKLRHFASKELAQKLGFALDVFTNATPEELALTPKGEEIETETFPDQTLFKIDNTYYQLSDSKLYAFVSEQAYLSNFDANMAIVENPTFLKDYELSENLLGFADGTLVSSPQSVFVLSENKSYPIDSAVTFEALGYTWNDVIPASSDEIGIYEKQKVFDINAIHPSGTVFFDQKTNRYSIFKDGKLHSLPSKNIVQSYLKKNPVLVDYAQLEIKPSCQLQKKLWPFRTYSCDLDITSLENLIGNNYRFYATLGNGVNLQSLDITLEKSIRSDNLQDSLSHIKQLLLQNYGVQQN